MTSAGREAVELATSAGLHLDPWEQLSLDESLGERADGKWAAFEVGVVAPRQNGKGSILEARELAGLFLFGEDLILHSAHEFKTAAEGFRRILALIEGTRDLAKRVKKVRTSHGDEGIELRTGQRLRFVARSRGSGRGFSGDTVILDEAFNLSAEAVAALLPTMAARPNPQLWYASSAPLITSPVLRKLCRRGRAGTSPRLAYLEWSADIGPDDQTHEERAARIAAALDDRQAWAQANPGLGIRIAEEFIEAEREAMDDEEFARERLGIWYDDEAERLIPAATWDLVNTPNARPEGSLTFALDVNPERSAAAVVAVAAGVIEVIDHRPGVGWLVGRATQLNTKWGQPTWAVDGSPSAPVASLVPELQRAGLHVEEVAGGELAAACGAFYDGVVDQQIQVRRHPSLDAAIEGAEKRDVGDGGWAWTRKGAADICALVAATVGLWVSGGAGDPANDVW